MSELHALEDKCFVMYKNFIVYQLRVQDSNNSSNKYPATDYFNLVQYISHRPIDLDNIYNQDQVKLLMKEGEELTVPDFDDIYADSEV